MPMCHYRIPYVIMLKQLLRKKQNVTLISKTSQIFLKYDFENKNLNDLFANDLIGNQTHKNTKNLLYRKQKKNHKIYAKKKK